MLTIQGRELSVLADTAGLRYTVRMACGGDCGTPSGSAAARNGP